MRGASETGAKKASNSPCKLAALPSGLFEGSHPPPGGLPARRRGLHWKDVMWQGARPRAGVGEGEGSKAGGRWKMNAKSCGGTKTDDLERKLL